MLPTVRWHWIYNVVILTFAVLAVLQIWSACSTRQIVNEAVRESASIDTYDFAAEKARQDLIGQRIANETKGNIPNNLSTSFGTSAAILISILGAVLVFLGQLNERQKEQNQKLAQEKDRDDRLATSLSETLSRLVSAEPRERVVGAAGLLPFFGSDRKAYHLQAFVTLIAAARMDDQPEMSQTIRLAVEHAARGINHDLLTQTSWQGVRLRSINLTSIDLHGLDLRDAKLEDAIATGATLDGANLENADLRGAQMEGATFVGANLKHADCAGAKLAGAVFRGAKIDSIKIQDLDLRETDFRGLKSGWRDAPWEMTLNWREAIFDEDVRAELEAKYGGVGQSSGRINSTTTKQSAPLTHKP